MNTRFTEKQGQYLAFITLHEGERKAPRGRHATLFSSDFSPSVPDGGHAGGTDLLSVSQVRPIRSATEELPTWSNSPQVQEAGVFSGLGFKLAT
jgi:hypothetical protein